MSRGNPLLHRKARPSSDLFLGPAGERGRIEVLTQAMIDADADAQRVRALPGWVKLSITLADGLLQVGYFADRAIAADGFQIACAEDAKARALGGMTQ